MTARTATEPCLMLDALYNLYPFGMGSHYPLPIINEFLWILSRQGAISTCEKPKPNLIFPFKLAYKTSDLMFFFLLVENTLPLHYQCS